MHLILVMHRSLVGNLRFAKVPLPQDDIGGQRTLTND